MTIPSWTRKFDGPLSLPGTGAALLPARPASLSGKIATKNISSKEDKSPNPSRTNPAWWLPASSCKFESEVTLPTSNHRHPHQHNHPRLVVSIINWTHQINLLLILSKTGTALQVRPAKEKLKCKANCGRSQSTRISYRRKQVTFAEASSLRINWAPFRLPPSLCGSLSSSQTVNAFPCLIYEYLYKRCIIFLRCKVSMRE